jgi:hypothetical protein
MSESPEIKIKQLELLQSAVNRMANNSFLIKGWITTLSTALFALNAKESDQSYALLAVYPALVLWGLDAYYLQLERKFRAKYETAAEGTGMTLSLQATVPEGYWAAVFATAVWPLYTGVLIVAALISGRYALGSH